MTDLISVLINGAHLGRGSQLFTNLTDVLDQVKMHQVIKNVLKDSDFATTLKEYLQQVIRTSYIHAFRFVPSMYLPFHFLDR